MHWHDKSQSKEQNFCETIENLCCKKEKIRKTVNNPSEWNRYTTTIDYQWMLGIGNGAKKGMQVIFLRGCAIVHCQTQKCSLKKCCGLCDFK